MKNIKDILNNYESQPSDDVWNRISNQLDQNIEKKAKKSNIFKITAAVFSVALIAAVSSIVIFSNNNVSKSENQGNRAELLADNVQEPIQEAALQSEIATIDNIANTSENQKLVNTKTTTSGDKSENKIIDKKQNNQENPKNETIENKKSEKSKVTQIVLPANSTLAKQLQSDPVLKNIDGEELTYEPPVKLQIPNLFTPNGDNVNDSFAIDGLENYDTKILVVRDKNGKIVFHSKNYNNEWSGEQCPDGVYYYDFTFSYNGIKNTASGKVRIIRN